MLSRTERSLPAANREGRKKSEGRHRFPRTDTLILGQRDRDLRSQSTQWGVSTVSRRENSVEHVGTEKNKLISEERP